MLLASRTRVRVDRASSAHCALHRCLVDYKSKSTLQATGLTVNVVEDTGSGDVRKTGTGVVSGATLTLTETCAFPARTLRVERADFTATSDRIELFGDVSGRTLVQTFRKR